MLQHTLTYAGLGFVAAYDLLDNPDVIGNLDPLTRYLSGALSKAALAP